MASATITKRERERLRKLLRQRPDWAEAIRADSADVPDTWHALRYQQMVAHFARSSPKVRSGRHPGGRPNLSQETLDRRLAIVDSAYKLKADDDLRALSIQECLDELFPGLGLKADDVHDWARDLHRRGLWDYPPGWR